MAKKDSKDRTGCEMEETPESRPVSETQEQPQRPVTPVREKIGEGHGNLRGRSDWFRKRSGDS
jgi:hypothetical protein